MKSPKLEAIGCEQLLRNAHSMFVENSRNSEWKRLPIWVFVRDLTHHGAGYSNEICRELGWNPDARATDPLPEPKEL